MKREVTYLAYILTLTLSTIAIGASAQNVVVECNSQQSALSLQYDQKKAECSSIRSAKGTKSAEYIACKSQADNTNSLYKAKKSECKSVAKQCSTLGKEITSTKRDVDSEKRAAERMQSRLDRQIELKSNYDNKMQAQMDYAQEQKSWAYAQSAIKCALAWMGGEAEAACGQLLDTVQKWETKQSYISNQRASGDAKYDNKIARYRNDLTLQQNKVVAAMAAYDNALNANSMARCPAVL